MLGQNSGIFFGFLLQEKSSKTTKNFHGREENGARISVTSQNAQNLGQKFLILHKAAPKLTNGE